MQDSLCNPSHGGNLAWAASLAGCSPLTILDFSASINPLGPPGGAIDAIQANLAALVHYPDPGYWALRKALSIFHQLPPDWILPGNGAAELLTWACRELAELNTTHLFTPAFGDYLRALNAFHANITPHLLLHTPTPLSSLLPFPPTPLHSGLLLNNPHNPTGFLFSTQSLLPLLEQFALVVIDEAFMDFLSLEQQQSLIEAIPDHPNLVIIRSLTKFYSLPGLRLGYAIAHPDRLQRWQQWRDPWSVNVLAEVAAIASLQDTQFQQQTWDWLPTARSHLFEGLATIPELTPFMGAANFLLVEANCSVRTLQRQLLQQHQILIRDCNSFPELGDRYFRVAVRTIEENQRLIDGLVESMN